MDLSTVRQPVAAQGAAVAQAILAAVAGSGTGPECQACDPAARSTVMTTELIVRGSTDPAATIYGPDSD